MELTRTTLDKLAGVHPDLVRVVKRAAKDWKGKNTSFVVTCGSRSMAEQRRLLAAGATTTLRSRHIPAGRPPVAHAVDLAVKVDGVLKWDWPLYLGLANAMKIAAQAEGVPLEWGGDWKSFKDGPHFQLPWNKYPG